MSQERLSNLALLSIESGLCENLDFIDLIISFADLKARELTLFEPRIYDCK
jgi:hypothetical protein